MTVDELLAALRRLPDAVVHPPADVAAVVALERRYGIDLPAFHRGLLMGANGVEAAGGYLRLFGVGNEATIDMGVWNGPDLWKPFWEPEIFDFFCFGEDGWGNQLAYRVGDLGRECDPPVYFLPSDLWSVGWLGASLASYLEHGFLPNAGDLDELDGAVRRALGDLQPGEHVIFSPPTIVSGDWSPEHAMKMPAVTAMILNGDVWMESQRITRRSTDFGGTVVAAEPYLDREGRPRVRLVSDDDVRAEGR